MKKFNNWLESKKMEEGFFDYPVGRLPVDALTGIAKAANWAYDAVNTTPPVTWKFKKQQELQQKANQAKVVANKPNEKTPKPPPEKFGEWFKERNKLDENIDDYYAMKYKSTWPYFLGPPARKLIGGAVNWLGRTAYNALNSIGQGAPDADPRQAAERAARWANAPMDPKTQADLNKAKQMLQAAKPYERDRLFYDIVKYNDEIRSQLEKWYYQTYPPKDPNPLRR